MLATKFVMSVCHRKICYNFMKLHIIPKRLAGHSHWQNVKNTKMAKDHQKSLLFNYLVVQIRHAIKEMNGNTNPETNPRLAEALKMARTNMVPKATLEKVLKKWGDSAEQNETHFYGVKGPNGVVFIIECLTSKPKIIGTDVTVVAKKSALQIADYQQLLYAFDKKGVIKVFNSDRYAIDANSAVEKYMLFDKAEEIAIENGAEEVIEDYIDDTNDNDTITYQRDILQFIVPLQEFNNIRTSLSNQYSLPIRSAEIEYLPKSEHMVKLTEKLPVKLCQRFFEKVSELIPSHNKIYTNLDPTSFAQLENTSNDIADDSNATAILNTLKSSIKIR